MPASRVDAMNMQDRCLISMQIFQLQLFCTLAVDCGKFPTLLNGKIHSHGTTYQSVVNFTCQDGYKLDGPSSALCLANGSWSDQLPKCIGNSMNTWSHLLPSIIVSFAYFSCGLWKISYSSEWQNSFSRHSVPVGCQLYMSRWLQA
jgi:hypothetical protein